MTEIPVKSGLDLTCRTCLLSPNLLISLFAEEEETGIALSFMLESCASIQIRKDDNLPKQVCLLCSKAIKAFYTFKELCTSSERNLKQMCVKSENGELYINPRINLNEIEPENSEFCLNSDNDRSKTEYEDGAIKLECEVEETLLQIKSEEEIRLNSDCNFNQTEDKPEFLEIENVNSGSEDQCNKFTCEICNKTLASRRNLVRHIRTHTKEKPYRCRQCDKAFARSRDCFDHEFIHEGIKRFKCDLCDKAFLNPTSLRRHILKQHTKEKSHVCTICSKTFLFLSGLKLHIRTHTGEKPYNCEVCNKDFPYSPSLWDHMRMHTGEKPHKCPNCDTGFIRKSHLTRHMKIHEHVKCDFCNELFASKINLKQHLISHVCRENVINEGSIECVDID